MTRMRDNRSDWTEYLEKYGVSQYQPTPCNVVSRLSLTVPWPPSVNRYWRHVGGKVLISEEGRKYRKAISAIVMAEGAKRLPPGRYAVRLTAYPPDNRRRDLDNLLKSLLDSLEHAGVYGDDELIDMLMVQRVWGSRRRGEVDIAAKVREMVALDG